MSILRTFLTMGLLIATSMCWAEKTDGLIVCTDAGEQQFAISDVREVTFGDQGLTLVKTDDAVVEFTQQWQIRFGEVETDGISLVEISESFAIAKVYDVEGRLVKEQPLSELRVRELPKGIYIVSCEGKSFKIIR